MTLHTTLHITHYTLHTTHYTNIQIEVISLLLETAYIFQTRTKQGDWFPSRVMALSCRIVCLQTRLKQRNLQIKPHLGCVSIWSQENQTSRIPCLAAELFFTCYVWTLVQFNLFLFFKYFLEKLLKRVCYWQGVPHLVYYIFWPLQRINIVEMFGSTRFDHDMVDS